MTKQQDGAVLRSFPLPSSLDSEFRKLSGFLKDAESILISSTLTSDGDSIGSQLALYEFIQKFSSEEKEVVIVNESPVPHRYKSLAYTDHIQTWKDWKNGGAQKSFDLGITCDGGVERTGAVREAFEKVPHKVLVDHHAVGSDMSYDVTLLDVDSSSTCELVYCLYEFFGIPLSKEVAELLYIGIVFDTGFFKHSLTKPKTHYVAAELVATGIDFSAISDRCILERSWQGQELLKKMLENAQRSSCGRVIISSWSHGELSSLDTKDGDQEGLINQLYHTEGCEVVGLFVETEPGQVKVSFRSKGKVNVADFARSLNSEGGGHKKASGCLLFGELATVREQVFQKLVDALDDGSFPL